MVPYRIPSTRFDREFSPKTALTPKIVSHGGGTPGGMKRVLKGNPVGWMESDGRYFPYFSARTEHYEQPVEHALLGDNEVELDGYGLATVMPREVQQVPRTPIRPDATSIFRWPDSSVSSSFTPHEVFGGLSHPGGDLPPGLPYKPFVGYEGPMTPEEQYQMRGGPNLQRRLRR